MRPPPTTVPGPGVPAGGETPPSEGLASSRAREHVVILWVFTVGLMLVTVFYATLMADVRERLFRLELTNSCRDVACRSAKGDPACVTACVDYLTEGR